MPKASNNRIPPAHNEHEVLRKTRDSGKDGEPTGGVTSYVAEPADVERRGVFPFPWGWQLAGLIGAIVTSLLFLAASAYAIDGRALLVLPGLALLGLAIYSAVETNWLREVMSKPLPVKIGAGVAVVCGLIPIAAGLLGVAIIAGIFYVLGAALASK